MFNCPTCGEEFGSFARYSRGSATCGHYAERQAARFAGAEELPEPTPGAHEARDGTYYSRNSEAAAARADAPDRGPSSGGSSSGPSEAAAGATPKQRAFLVKLCDERGVGVQERWFASKATASAAIEELLAQPKAGAGGIPASGAVVHEGASPKQSAFIAKLAAERGLAVEADWLSTRGNASAAIDRLLAMPKAAAHSAKVKADPDSGLDMSAPHLARGTIHVLGEDVLRVHHSQTSGYAYAVRAAITEPATWADGVIVRPGTVEWELAKGAIYKLTAATVATAEQSAAFGKLAGRCVYCGRAIDTPESTAVGYGPVCAAKYGLPWGDTTTPGAQVPHQGTGCEGGGGDGPDGTCGPNGLCSRHSWEYQRGTRGRAFTE